jgi:hypothetical protein
MVLNDYALGCSRNNGGCMPQYQGRPDYPYGLSPLRPQFGDRWSQIIAGSNLISMGISLFVHATVWPANRLALLVVLPGLLGITLAFAPDPPVLVSCLAKRMTAAGCAVGTFAGSLLAPMILAVPAMLALAVAIGWWMEGRGND